MVSDCVSVAMSLPAPHTWQQQRAGWWRSPRRCLSWSFPGTASSASSLGRTWPGLAALWKHDTQVSGFKTYALTPFLLLSERLWSSSGLTNSILWWQVDSVCVEVLQKGSVHQVWELMDFHGVLVCFIQQCTEMLTPTAGRKDSRHNRRKSSKTITNEASFTVLLVFLPL